MYEVWYITEFESNIIGDCIAMSEDESYNIVLNYVKEHIGGNCMMEVIRDEEDIIIKIALRDDGFLIKKIFN